MPAQSLPNSTSPLRLSPTVMPEQSAPLAHNISDGGISGSHPELAAANILVAPSTAAEQNRVTAGLIPVGCWRVDDLRFEFDSSFVLPAVAEEIRALAAVRDFHKKRVIPRTSPAMPEFLFPPMTVFGHADPVGQDDYNKILSGRRAAAIYGLLTRRTDIWEDLFGNRGQLTGVAAGDKWGDSSLQTMQSTTGLPKGTSHAQLFLAYMDVLCVVNGPDGKPVLDADGKPVSFKLDPVSDFLAGGDDEQGKGDFQGCGEFNPVLIFSQQENDAFEKAKDKTARNAANASNRRVLVLLFRPGSKVLATKWPCPRAKEGTAGCVKRFWSDAKDRRSRRLPEQDRKFQDTPDTFACRFYQRLVTNSPCERTVITFEIRLYSPSGVFIPSAPFELTVGGGKPRTGVANEKGVVIAKDVEVPNQCSIRWGFPPDKDRQPELIFTLKMFLNADEQEKVVEATQKLHNLGYPIEAKFPENVTSFQRDYGDLADPPLQLTGQLDDDTLQLIRDVYRSCRDDLSQQQPGKDASG
jgi:hypothetical protein